MYARARYKLDIDDKVIQAGRFDNKSTQEEQEEFLVSYYKTLRNKRGRLILGGDCRGVFLRRIKRKTTKSQAT